MLQKLAHKIFKAAEAAVNRMSGKDLWVVFGGFYKQGEAPAGKNGNAEFRLYLSNENGYTGLPARAGNEMVARKISKMKLGQAFKIVSERSDGGLGAIVDKIEMGKDFPVHNLKANKLPF